MYTLPESNIRHTGEQIARGPSFIVEDQLSSLTNQAETDLDSNTLRALLKVDTTTLDWQMQEKIESILAAADEE